MNEHSYEEESASYLSEEGSDLASAATNLSHEALDDRSSYTEADETFADRSLSLDDGTDQQIPLAGEDDGEYEVEGADKPPPMMSRLAAGMRKSLTNLFGIFGGPVVENLGEEEEEEEESYAGSVEGSLVDDDVSRSVNGSSLADDASLVSEVDHMEVVAADVKEAADEQEGVVPEAAEPVDQKPDEDVEIHSLLLDEGVAAPAPVIAASPVAAAVGSSGLRTMETMVIEEELAVVEVIHTHSAFEQSDSEDEEEKKVEVKEKKVVEEKKVEEEKVDDEDEEEEEEEEEQEEEEEEEVSQSYIDAMDKRLRALTKNELSAQLKPRGEKTYGLKEELVVRLRNCYLREEKEARQKQQSAGGSDAAAQRAKTTATATKLVDSLLAAVPATPTRKRGRPPKKPATPATPEAKAEAAADDEEQQVVVAEPTKAKKVAKRRKVAPVVVLDEDESTPDEQEEDVEMKTSSPSSSSSTTTSITTTVTRSMWPSLVPKTLPQAYEPSCGWDASLGGGEEKLPFSLPDPGTVREWDLENDEGLHNQVALLRLWVLSQPINLNKKHSKTNPTFFEALEEWERPAKRETKKEQLERLQGCYGEWVYGTTDAPEVPLEKPAGRAAARRK